MGAKIASFLAAVFLSIPLAAIGLMAIFGVPQLVPASGGQGNSTVLRGVQDVLNWNRVDNNDSVASLESAVPFNAQPHQNSASFQPSVEANQPTGTPFASRQTPVPGSSNANAFNHPQWNNQQANALNQPNTRNPFESTQTANEQAATTQTAGNAPAAGWPMDSAPKQPASNGFNSRAFDMNSAPLADVSTGNTQPSQRFTLRQASKRLSDLGITHFHLERGLNEGSFLFVCLYSPSDNPQVTHRFEAEAAEPETAVNQVLHQVETWMQTRFANSNFPNRGQSFSMNPTP